MSASKTNEQAFEALIEKALVGTSMEERQQAGLTDVEAQQPAVELMKKYDNYKDSGIQWLGEIPSHWKTVPLKRIVSCNDETLQETTDKNKIIDYVEISDVDISRGIFNYSTYSFSDAPSRARRIARKSDIIISTVRTYLKAIATVDFDSIVVSTGFAVIRAKKALPAFLKYGLCSDYFVDSIARNSIGVSYPAITASLLTKQNILLPPPTEQKAIASYLDKQTSKINEAIAQQQKMIDLLNERKRIIICEAVTKGLNRNAPLKGSDND